MKKLIFKTMLLSGALLASCSEDVLEAPVQEEYAKSFVDIFGPVHPEQDWNMAEQKSVTVNVSNPTDVKIYANEGESYRMVGKYTNISGKQTFKFDALETAKDFSVFANGKVLKVKNGETADFSSVSRTYHDNVKNIFTKLTEYKKFDGSVIRSFSERLTESDDHTNDVGLKKDFFATVGQEQFLQDNKVTVYPMFWNASFYHTVGIYTYNEQGNLEKTEIFDTRVGDDLLAKTGNREVEANGQPAYDINNLKYIKSRGFTIDLPVNTPFGFYIDVYDKDKTTYLHTWYSEKGHNYDGYVHASYFQQQVGEKTYTFLGFEDAHFTDASKNGTYNRKSDRDLNDVMFILDPAPVIYENETQSWIIAAEDLGTTDDYDFNDLVVEVTHEVNTDNKTGTVYLTPLAAGGIHPIYLLHNGEEIANEAGATEFHEQLKAGVKASNGAYPMLNTTTAGPRGETFAITVQEPWSLQSFLVNVPMGGLSLRVEHGKELEAIIPPGTGEAPQMICVPSPWMWPTERTRIDIAYPLFSTWSSDDDPSTTYENTESPWGDLYNNGQFWSTTPESGKALKNSNE